MTSGAAQPNAPAWGRRRRALAWGVAWVIATVLLALNLGRLDWGLAVQQIGAIRPGWIVAALVANLIIIPLWAAQWWVFLPRGKPVGYRTMFGISALMAMAVNTAPFWVGQASGVVLLARRGGVGHAVALSVMALDQLAEGVAKLTVLLLVARLTAIPPWLKDALTGMVAAVALLAVVLIVLAYRFRRPTTAGPPRTGWTRVIAFGRRWAHHLDALRDPRVFALGLVVAICMKTAEAAGILFIQRAFGVELPLWSVLLVLASLNLATMVSVAPGNLGVYEATVAFVYQFLGLPPETAVGLALLQHVAYVLPLIATGYLFLALPAAGVAAQVTSPRLADES